MIDNHILGAIFIHLFAAIFQLIAWRKTVTQRVISVLGSFLGVLLALRLLFNVHENGILTLNASNWEAPYGIVFVADLLSATLVLLTSIAALAVSFFSSTGLRSEEHTSELQSRENLVCRLLLEKKKII